MSHALLVIGLGALTLGFFTIIGAGTVMVFISAFMPNANIYEIDKRMTRVLTGGLFCVGLGVIVCGLSLLWRAVL